MNDGFFAKDEKVPSGKERRARSKDRSQYKISRAVEEEELYELEESDSEAVDLEREAAYIKEELAAAKLELITGKEERINWRRFFEFIFTEIRRCPFKHRHFKKLCHTIYRQYWQILLEWLNN